MQHYEMVEDGIRGKDIAMLRKALEGLCYVDPNFSSGEFDEIVKYIESKNIRLKDDVLNGKLISNEKENFTKEDFRKAVFLMKENFCDERIAEVKNMGKILYPTKEKKDNKQAGKDPNVVSRQDRRTVLVLVAGVVTIILFLILLMK